MLSEVPEAATCAAKSSSKGRDMEVRKLTYAEEYKPFCKSDEIASRLAAVGSTI